MNIDLFDPYVNSKNYKNDSINILNNLNNVNKYDGIIVCVAHKEFKNKISSEWASLCKKECIILDIKNIVPKDIKAIRL